MVVGIWIGLVSTAIFVGKNSVANSYQYNLLEYQFN